MADLQELEQKGLVEAFGLKPEEVADARYNLLGFFNVLYKIDERLKKEKLEAAGKGGGRD